MADSISGTHNDSTIPSKMEPNDGGIGACDLDKISTWLRGITEVGDRMGRKEKSNAKTAVVFCDGDRRKRNWRRRGRKQSRADRATRRGFFATQLGRIISKSHRSCPESIK